MKIVVLGANGMIGCQAVVLTCCSAVLRVRGLARHFTATQRAALAEVP